MITILILFTNRNGRWRSHWSVTFDPSAIGESVELKGVVKVQVHYYEDGNVQLVSSKDVKQNIQIAVSLVIITLLCNQYQLYS